MNITKKKKYQYTALTSTILLVVAIIIFNLIFSVLADKISLKIDLTKDNILSFSETTEKIISELDREVNIISLIPQSNTDREIIQIDEVLKKYDRSSDKINYTRVDSKKNPAILTKYQHNGGPIKDDYHIIFEVKDRMHTVVSVNDLVPQHQDYHVTYALAAEQFFSSAIVKVTKGSNITAYVSEGHGERFNADNFKNNILPGSGYEFKSITLMSSEIPKDADILILASPKTDYSSDEIQKIDEYLKQGGDIQIIADIDTGDLTNLYAYMSEWGVGFDYGMAADADESNYAGYQTYIIGQVEKNDLSATMGIQSQQLLFPFARPVNIKEAVNTSANVLVKTGENGYIKQNIYSTEAGFEDGDINAPSNLAVMLTRQYSPESASNMFVMGTSLFMGSYDSESSPFYTLLSESSNRSFCSALMSYMTDQPTNFYIIPKNVYQDRVVIDQLSIYIYVMLTVVFIPIVILAAGFIIWIKRRNS